MRVDLLLADSAQADASGKVHALGLGWSVTSTPTPPAAVVAFIWANWTEANIRFDFRCELVDGDGNPVLRSDEAVAVWGQTEIGRPAGIPVGSDLMTPVVVTLDGGLVLVPGQSYEWRITVGTARDPRMATSRAGFAVRQV